MGRPIRSTGAHGRKRSRRRPIDQPNINFRFQRFARGTRRLGAESALPGHRLPTHHQHTIHRTPHAMPHSTLRKCISFRTPSNERNSFRFQIPPNCCVCGLCAVLLSCREAQGWCQGPRPRLSQGHGLCYVHIQGDASAVVCHCVLLIHFRFKCRQIAVRVRAVREQSPVFAAHRRQKYFDL